MSDARGAAEEPSRGRKIAAAIVVVLVVIGAWKLIDYRMQPPPPPNPIGALPSPP